MGFPEQEIACPFESPLSSTKMNSYSDFAIFILKTKTMRHNVSIQLKVFVTSLMEVEARCTLLELECSLETLEILETKLHSMLKFQIIF
jgi:hypothetical protein